MVSDHLVGTARLCSRFAEKAGFPLLGELMGLLHDVGKYSDAFQSYLMSAEGKIEPDDEEYVDATRAKGKIDHSTAGAQYVWEKRGGSPARQMIAELVALCVASHHSGLIDCLSAVGADVIGKRMSKAEERAHFAEVRGRIDGHLGCRVEGILSSTALEKEIHERLLLLGQGAPSQEVRHFLVGLLARFLFSSLVDADRLNSAERAPAPRPPWSRLREKLEAHLSNFAVRNNVDATRAEISSSCLAFAEREKGFYQLTVPTGGGKTLASLRFALRHAEKHQMDRVVYVVPYTSIIDQNARVACSVFADLEADGQQIVLEHHSNLTPERDTPENKLLAENWDAPIVYTTAVQLLETLFGPRTRGPRRFHQLANAVVIFDEVQTLPIRIVHLFNNAVNFLTRQCGSTVVFCTATQPLLDKVDPQKGAAVLSENGQMTLVGDLFRKLRRVDIEDRCKPEGWTEDEVADAATRLLAEAGSVLVVVNKKAQARSLFMRLQGRAERVCHLSTSMCPAHRMKVLDEVKWSLDPVHPSPVICVSTQLIEAGVDVDFGAAIRYLAGLDSVAQTAGRCNRNGLRSRGTVLIVNPANEKLDRLPDIRKAQEVTRRVLAEYHTDPAAFDHDLQGPAAMSRFYLYHFYGRKHEMAFPVSSRAIGRDGDLLSLLSDNREAVEAYKAAARKAPPYLLRQSFMTAAKAFRAIDSETEGVIVPYGREGEILIADLCSASQAHRRFELLKAAQRYSVNLFPYEVRQLGEMNRLRETWDGSGIYYLDERHYSEQFGVARDEVSEMRALIE